MDDELKELAALALRNAFWRDFSALTNTYLHAAEGLDVEAQERQMAELTSVYGRNRFIDDDIFINIWTQNVGGVFATTGCATIVEALEHDKALEVYVSGEKVFERYDVDGEWRFAGGYL